MAKKQMKRDMGIEEGQESLVDTHRLIPKQQGGIYVDGNVVLSDPVEHQEIHGNKRIRSREHDELKNLIDDRENILSTYLAINNQLLAYKRHTDIPNIATVSFYETNLLQIEKEVESRGKLITEWVKDYATIDPLIKATINVKCVGPLTVAYLTVYLDFEKAKHVSSFWAYAGYDKPSHERYTKGVAGGGNKRLRTMLYNTSCSFMKHDGPYRDIYDRVKTRLEQSELMVKSRNTQGKLIECMWKNTKPSHRHGAALRVIAKTFLADYYFVGKTLKGMPLDDLYIKEHLGHQSAIINPRERGWKF